MTKRQQLDYDSGALVEHLKASTGQGVDAFFSNPSPSIQNSEGTQSEQQGAPFSKPYARTAERTAERTDARTTARAADNAVGQRWTIPAIPRKRRPERYAFQFWADQIIRLKKLNQLLVLLIDPDDQSPPTLSDLVRVALDDFLEARIKELQQSAPVQNDTTTDPSERTTVLPYACTDARTDFRTVVPTADSPAP